MSFWNEFKPVIISVKYSALKGLSFDSIDFEQTVVGFDKFIKYHTKEVLDDSLEARISSKESIEFLSSLEDLAYYPEFIQKTIKQKEVAVVTVNVDNDNGPNPVIKGFYFIKTQDGYKFYRYDRFG